MVNKKLPPKKGKVRKKQKGRGYLTIKQIETALRGTGGFVTYAAKKLNCSHQNITKRIKGSPYLTDILNEIRESYLDLTEHSLIKKIQDEDLGAIIFFLKCQGKNRGYIERPPKEDSHEEKDQIVFNIDLGD